LRVSEIIARARRSAFRQLEALRAGLRGAGRGLPRPHMLLAIPRQRVDAAGTRLGLSLCHFSERSRGRFERCAVRLTPRLVVLPFERSAERLARAGDSALRAFRLSAAKKRDHLSSRSDRLRPGLLAGPAARQRERLHTLAARAGQGIRNALTRKASEAGSLSQLLRTLSHKSVLERGFALVRDANGQVLRRASAIKGQARLDIEFADGHVEADVPGETPEDERAFAERKRIVASRRSVLAKKDDGSQGSLL
jgi:exodeoxyribonuclease VII large subunit